MRITHCVFMSTMLIACNAWGELEILQAGIHLEPAGKPDARKMGTLWKGLKNGQPHSIEFVSETDSSTTFKASDGCTWTRPNGFYRAPSTEWTNCEGRDGTARVKFKGGTIYPFQVGNKWSYEQNGGAWRTSRDCKVEDAVRVKTNVGEQDTFKIVCVDKWNTRTNYYSPQLQTAVHSERWHHRSGKRTIYEFINYE